MKAICGIRGAILALVIAIVGVTAGAGVHNIATGTAPARHTLAGESMPPIPMLPSTLFTD